MTFIAALLHPACMSCVAFQGFIDELGVKHVSNHNYDWKY